jgi:uncharacterized protein
MPLGVLSLTIHLPACHSLKEKRRLIKPILTRLHREFNISVIEYDHHDSWQTCELLIACAVSRGGNAENLLAQVLSFYESHWPDLPLTQEKIEIIN